jgi:UDP-2,3-diacylglucosamine pyrophosphatase LpxH
MYLSKSVRSLFVSDLHLGSQHCHPRAFASLLRSVEVESLYLVGDMVDGWLLKKSWNWNSCFDEAINAISCAASRGATVTYILGNHDRNLSEILASQLPLRVVESVVHVAADGRRLLVVHGDCFDRSQTRFSGMSRFAAGAHERLLGGSKALNHVLGMAGISPRRYGTMITLPVKHAMQKLSRFDLQLCTACCEADCDGIIYGHTLATTQGKRLRDFRKHRRLA